LGRPKYGRIIIMTEGRLIQGVRYYKAVSTVHVFSTKTWCCL